jgi:hypothetical protein
MWTDADMAAFAQTMRALGQDPAMALQVYSLETGGTLDPHAMNAGSKAQGLAQFMPATLRDMGYLGDPLQFHTLALQLQLPWIGRLVQTQQRQFGGVIPSAAKWLHLQLRPNNAGSSTLVYSQAANPLEYGANRWLDSQGRGFIDETDLAAALVRAQHAPYLAAIDQLRRVSAA